MQMLNHWYEDVFRVIFLKGQIGVDLAVWLG